MQCLPLSPGRLPTKNAFPAPVVCCSFVSPLGVCLSCFVFKGTTGNFNSDSHPYPLKGQFLPSLILLERLPGLFPFKNVSTSKGQRNKGELI